MKLKEHLTVEQIANEFGLKYFGNSKLEITGINEIHKVQKGDLAYVDHPKYYEATLNSAASVIIINKVVEVPYGKAILISDNPFEVYNELVNRYMIHLNKPQNFIKNEISPKPKIGEGTLIYPGVFIANNVKIGKNCIIHPNVVIYNGTVIGDEVIIKANSTIGGDAFYYTHFKKWHACGRVVIHDRVHIGSNCTIDKGVSGDTVIGKDSKIDNQIHIAHGVVVGERVLMAAGVGIAGKSTIGNDVFLMGHVGVVKNVNVGDGVTVLSKALVTKDLKQGKTYFGNPAQDVKIAFKELATLRKLPEFSARVEKIMKEIEKAV